MEPRRNIMMDLRCALTDSVKCTGCGFIRRVSELIAVNGQTVPKAQTGGEYWQQVFYYCPCDNKGVKVYDPGDGKLVVVYLACVELILDPAPAELIISCDKTMAVRPWI